MLSLSCLLSFHILDCNHQLLLDTEGTPLPGIDNYFLCLICQGIIDFIQLNLTVYMFQKY